MKNHNQKNIKEKPSHFKQILAFFVLLSSSEMIMVDISYLKWSLLISGSVILLFILWLFKFRFWHKEVLVKMIIPVLFTAGGLSLLLLIPSPLIAHIYSVVIAFAFAFIVRNINSEDTRKGRNFDGFRLNDAFVLASAFLSFSSLFGFYIFLNLKSWVLIICLSIIVMLLIYQYFWHEGFLNAKNKLYIPVVGLVFTEISWALTFWPTGFVTRAVILFVLFYCFVGLVKLHVSERLVFKTARKYLFVSLIVLSLVLGTTKWYF